MFRITQYMQEIRRPTPIGPRRDPPGPVVIWNLIRRCNLACQHCYSISADIDFPGELTTPQIYATMDDLTRAVQELKEENQFLQRLIEEMPPRTLPPPPQN